LGVRVGNLRTNMASALFIEEGVTHGDFFDVTIIHNKRVVYEIAVLYGRSFADSHLGASLIYVNSVVSLGFAINQGCCAQAYKIGTGDAWQIAIEKSKSN